MDILLTLVIAVPLTALVTLVALSSGQAKCEYEIYMEGYNAGHMEGYRKGLGATQEEGAE
jgi:hypothetical protein